MMTATKAWDKKVYSYNYFDLSDSDKRKAQLDKYFVDKDRPKVVVSNPQLKVKKS